MLHYLYTYPETIVDGDGIRFSIYLSGCRHHCRGCHNPESWNPASGHPLTREKIEEFIEAINYLFGRGSVLFTGRLSSSYQGIQ